MSAQGVRYEVLLREKRRLEAMVEELRAKGAKLQAIAAAAEQLHALLWHRAAEPDADIELLTHDEEVAAVLRERLQALRAALEARA